MALALANPTVIINNLSVSIVPGSFTYTEGNGEQAVRVQSAGGGSIQTVYSNDVTTNFSKVKFSMYPTAENIDVILSWKNNTNKNAISATGDGLTRSFTSAALTNDYEVALGADTQIDLEWKTNPAV